MSRVSGNRASQSDWKMVLRAVGLHIKGGDVVYTAKSLLSNADPTSPTVRAYNRGVLDMTALLLKMPETDPAVIERVLRSLPEE